MTPQDLQALVDYNYWATHRLLAAVDALTPEQFVRDLASSFRSVRDTLTHVHDAEWIWLSRLHGSSPASRLPVDRFQDCAALRAGWAETEAGLRTYVGDLDDTGAQRVLEYRLLNGNAAADRVWHLVQHVVNHGTYHRGQVTTMLRQLGAAPPAQLDLVAYYRERQM
jgi:uncharacterized damage-inducible protein DinB